MSKINTIRPTTPKKSRSVQQVEQARHFSRRCGCVYRIHRAGETFIAMRSNGREWA
jgi:hypothetical protein